MKYLIAAAILASILALPVHANVSLPAIFGDHMVLQQGLKLPVWGKADPGEEVIVSIGNQQKKTVTDALGRWTLLLEPLKQSTLPLEMKVKGKNTLVISDVLVGDVWVCSGQSNMAFPVGKATDAAEALPSADYPLIRLFKVRLKVTLDPSEDCFGKWIVCKPDSPEVGGFSAVGFSFAKEIHGRQKVPIGMVGAYWGGSPAQAWTSLEALLIEPSLKYYADNAQSAKATMSQLKAQYVSETLPAWEKAYEEWKARGQPKGQPRKPIPPDGNFRLATVLFNGMINPIIPFGIKGVIWYQGESNAEGTENVGKGKEYATLFPALIKDWRARWNQGNFPFIYVQLPGFKIEGEEWTDLRESQRKTLSIPNTAMAVTIDLGERSNIHPKNKRDVAQRLAIAARHVAYGEDIIHSGPAYKSMKVDGGKIALSFDHVGSGLIIGSPTTNVSVKGQTASILELQAFEISGKDGKFVSAKAEIIKDTVIVSAKEVQAPINVRYAWMAWPEPMANLYNKEGLPALPFSTQEMR